MKTDDIMVIATSKTIEGFECSKLQIHFCYIDN